MVMELRKIEKITQKVRRRVVESGAKVSAQSLSWEKDRRGCVTGGVTSGGDETRKSHSLSKQPPKKNEGTTSK